MADSYRLAVLKALTAQLETIAVADGYTHDLAGLVFRGRNRWGESDPDVMISILENPRPDIGQFAGEPEGARAESWPLFVQGWVPDDIENPTDPAYGLMDDVETCLARITAVVDATGEPKYQSEFLLGNRITSFRFGPGVVRPPTDGLSVRAFFYLPVYVGLAVTYG
ncbi:MAG: hypothetical protein KDG50_07045 [Chromatiales bacterium]|nr:hypothetical protein [Chromatiales bacterium]